jgi:hypothetical protein
MKNEDMKNEECPLGTFKIKDKLKLCLQSFLQFSILDSSFLIRMMEV